MSESLNDTPTYVRARNALRPKRRIPVLLQSESSECGLACLAMVASHHGQRRDIASLRREVSVSLKGMTLGGLMKAAERIGFAARPLRFELEALSDLAKPCILHWDMNHFVVLTKANRRRATIIDPARGCRMIDVAELSKHATGVALELTPTPGFSRHEDRTPVRMSDFWERLSGFKRSLGQLFLLSLLLQVFTFAGPLYTQLVVDEAITKGDLQFLRVLAIGFVMLLAIELATTVLREHVSLHFTRMLGFQTAANLFRHLLRLPAAFFEKRHIGDITSRFGSLKPIEALLTSGIVTSVLDGLLASLTLVMILLYSPLLTAIVVGTLAVHLLVQLAAFRKQRRLQEEGIHLGAKLQSIFLESIRAAPTIKLFGKERDREVLWQNSYADQLNADVRLTRFGISLGAFDTILFGLENIAVLYVGALLVLSGDFTLGMLFAFQAYRRQFTGRIQGLIGQLIAFRMLGLHLERLGDIVHAEREPDEPVGGDTVQLEGGIGARGVAFRYGEHEPLVLRDVSFSVRPGECAVITGPSGGGKSTLLKLLLGLQSPTEGQVLVDGTPIDGIGRSAYRSQIGVVMQNDSLLSGSITDNISFFDAEATPERVASAARAAGLHEEVAAMPMGYQSLIGDMGSTLSGGQAQRVLIARALYRQPRILFLDEGTANLDGDTEASIIEMVDRLPITRIVVAHRPAVFAIADRMLRVEGGTLRELAANEWPAPGPASHAREPLDEDVA